MHKYRIPKNVGRAIGEAIRCRRIELGMSRQAMATLAGLPLHTVQNWESAGLPVTVDATRLKQLEPALQMQHGYLVCTAAHVRSRVGQIARERRENLGLSCAAVANRIDISEEDYARWEAGSEPASLGHTAQRRWESALDIPTNRLLEKVWRGPQMIASAPPVSLDGFGWDEPIHDLPRWGRELITVPEGATASQTIAMVAHRLADPRAPQTPPGPGSETYELHAQVVAGRYGVSGHGRTALADVGRDAGLSGQRAHQIMRKVLARRQDFVIVAPVFERLSKAAADHLPCPAPRLETLLQPLLGKGLAITDANRFAADLLGNPFLNFETRRVGRKSPSQVIALAPSQCE